MKNCHRVLSCALKLSLSGIAASTFAAENYSPFVDRTGLETVYWGDTHLHTAYSTDAGMVGNTLSPDEAYRFARGEEVTSSFLPGLMQQVDERLESMRTSRALAGELIEAAALRSQAMLAEAAKLRTEVEAAKAKLAAEKAEAAAAAAAEAEAAAAAAAAAAAEAAGEEGAEPEAEA